MSSIQKIFHKRLFIITISYLLIALANASNTDLVDKVFSTSGATEEVSRPLKTVRILSLDGGGVKGVATARLLEHFEANLGCSISDTFHLVGGTSAGGIISTFLTTPVERGSMQAKYSAGDLVGILRERCEDMFVTRHLSFLVMFGPKYRTDCFRSVLSEFLGHDTIDNVTTPTAVVSYDLVRQKLKIISSSDREVLSKVNSIHASAAAPFYFAPCYAIPVNNAKKAYELSDGGTGANNPTLCLITKAMELYPDADNFEIVSIGSGRADKPLSHQVMKDAGLMQWAPHLARIFMAGEASKDDAFLSEAFLLHTDSRGHNRSAFNGHYSRWNPPIGPQNTKLDNTNSENISELITAADRHIKSRKTEFMELIERLRSPKVVF